MGTNRGAATGWSLLSWVLFAGSGPVAKAVMAAGWSPAAVTSLRITVAAVVLVPVVAVVRPRALAFGRGDLWLLLGYGVLGVAGVQLFFFVAVARVPVGVAMVLVNAAPVLVALWVRVVRRTRLPGLVWLGIGLAIAGLVLVARLWHVGDLDLLGIGAGLAAAVCSAGYFLLGEHSAGRLDPVGVTAAGLAIGAVVVVAAGPLWTVPRLDAPAVLGGLAVPAWLAMLALAGLGTVVPYLVGLRALRDLPSTVASVLALVEPLVAAGLAWLLLGQALGPAQLAGAATLLAGAVLVQLALRERRPRAERDGRHREHALDHGQDLGPGDDLVARLDGGDGHRTAAGQRGLPAEARVARARQGRRGAEQRGRRLLPPPGAEPAERGRRRRIAARIRMRGVERGGSRSS